jgi:hypothetical protein
MLEALEDRAVPASLGYSTYLPGNIYATAVDSAGDIYVTGSVGSNLPTTPGAFETSGDGAFVAKLNPTGTAVIYATYLGNGSAGSGTGIAVDSAGDAYVIGENTNVPTTSNAIASASSGDVFVAELNPTGSGLTYATYLPGAVSYLSTQGYSGAIAVDGSGTIYVAGATEAGFTVTANAYQATYGGSGGSTNAFFAKINPTLSGSASLVYATYLGGNNEYGFGDAATGIALDGSGNAYVIGYTSSTNFPTTAGAFQTSYGTKTLVVSTDAFLAKVDPALSGAASLAYSTYLGGNRIDGSVSSDADYGDYNQTDGGIAVDSQGDAYVTSATTSTNFPTTTGAFQVSSGLTGKSSPSDAFVTKLNATGTALVYSTYLGGGKNTYSGGAAIALDASDDAYVTGWTNSTVFPTKNPIQATNAGGTEVIGGIPNYDAFVTTLNPAGSALLFSTYLGGTADDDAMAIALDPAGNVYVAGVTGSSNFPTTGGLNVGGSGFAVKINTGATPTLAITAPSTSTAGLPDTFTVTALNANDTVDTAFTGTVQFSSSDPDAVLPAASTLTDGTGTFKVTLTTAGSQWITATDSAAGITGNHSAITVSPGAPSQVVFTEQPTGGLAGSSLNTFKAALEDPYGNLETGDNTDAIAVSVNSGPSSVLAGPATQTVQGGIATFSLTTSNLVLDTSGTYMLAATADLTNGVTLGPVTSAAFTVTSPVSTSFGNITYNSKTGLYSETVTLTNTSGSTLTGPIALELTGLPSGVSLTDATGTQNGDPYVDFLNSGKTLKRNASVSITLTFTAASASDIDFGTEVVVGL